MYRNNNIGFTDEEYLKIGRIGIENGMNIHDTIIEAVEYLNEKDDIDYHDLLHRGD